VHPKGPANFTSNEGAADQAQATPETPTGAESASTTWKQTERKRGMQVVDMQAQTTHRQIIAERTCYHMSVKVKRESQYI
jgi:hypothetical protein